MNVLLSTDVYKMGHMSQYTPGITKVYSYLTTRSDKNFKELTWFGLKYYVEKYLKAPITANDAFEFIGLYEKILGVCPRDVQNKILALAQLGYWPLEVKALEENQVYPIGTVLMTITNTLPDFYWCVGFIESLLLKVWFPSTVATYSAHYRKLAKKFYDETVSEANQFLLDYAVHDFGYRGDTSEESAAISGGAHLLNFKGSDTVLALPFVENYYPEYQLTMQSVPASEHSVMCSFGRHNEIEAVRNMLRTYPTGIVSIVADTYDLWEFITGILPQLKDDILARDGKVVIRPDSGDPVKIICGNDEAENPLEWRGCLQLLADIFDYTVNEKDYKELNPKIGLIYGDGMYLERYEKMLETMKAKKWAASNLVIGVGGILRNHSRDTLGFALKATYVEVDGEGRDIMKDPITDPSKRSLTGLLMVDKNNLGHYFNFQGVTNSQEKQGLLKTVYKA